ncbi:transcriptional regulator LytR [Clostridium saccharobutylicum]|uniref:LCP family protein n=1 Tax=Clostridium saccharobutylicum TaxID=169679 RepID=UPI00098400BA|nr:LCP family protein [Clostridium saccharobutylicum]AQS08562.1 transcriptional regulator LytR [Clostridium saccharobutylicum]MBC2436036.1 LCP family protein [Clostridium saccharobutylicum]NSB87807.1 LCP family protein required for cell wall assembly [Clostridium saccharobutylicum]OOM13265.1 transcriptional regulator LytR [Clostridium saccharobutylicum]
MRLMGTIWKIKRFIKGDGSTSILERIILGAISIILTFFIFSLISGAFALMKVGSKSMPAGIDVSSNEPVNILLLGTDIGNPNEEDNQSIKRTDTIMVLNYNPQDRKINIVSVPRDTLININGRNWKINAAYEIGGYPKIKSEVENLLNININYIVKLDYNAFRDIIDAIGGVKMQIDRNMIYDDDAQNLHINFKAGETVTLDGKKAEEFFRWRKNNDGSGLANGDLDRIENQHKFISKVVEKCTSPFVFFRVPKILSALGDDVETNMSPTDIISYGLKFITVNHDNVSMTTVSGTPKMINGQSYLVPDKNSNKDVISSSKSSTKQSSSTATNTSSKDIRIKILNGTKINGLASKAMKELNGAGYKNIDTGNTELSNESIILANDNNALNTIKNDINIKKSNKKKSTAEYNNYDVVIILGKDFKEFGK